jgi:hypothetical protein
MKFTKLKGDQLVNVNIFEYKLDFDDITGSKPEIAVKTFLKKYWSKDLVLSEFRIPSSLLRIDILSVTKKIIIEVSPKSTHSFNLFMHKNLAVFAGRLQKEIQKEEWASRNGFVYIELGDDELKNLSKQMFKDKFGVDL